MRLTPFWEAIMRLICLFLSIVFQFIGGLAKEHVHLEEQWTAFIARSRNIGEAASGGQNEAKNSYSPILFITVYR